MTSYNNFSILGYCIKFLKKSSDWPYWFDSYYFNRVNLHPIEVNQIKKTLNVNAYVAWHFKNLFISKYKLSKLNIDLSLVALLVK